MLIKSTFLATLIAAATARLSAQERTSHGKARNSYEGGLTWTGQIEEGGKPMSFTGSSLQHIEEQIREIKPDFSWSRKTEPRSRGPSIRSEGDILCDLTWDPPFASVFHTLQGIDYLHKSHGNCTNGPGPANCGRVSCSYGSGIWFCNDNPYPISVPCSTFGDRASYIVEKCYAYGHFPTDSVHGQAFDTDGWNVYVAGADC